jgi:hypothetical protein
MKLFTRQTSHRKEETFFLNILSLSHFVHKNEKENAALWWYTSRTVAVLTTETASEHAHARLLPSLS